MYSILKELQQELAQIQQVNRRNKKMFFFRNLFFFRKKEI